MSYRAFIFHPSTFILALLAVFVCAQARVETCQSQTVENKAQGKDAKKINPETLKKYVGRYELETGIIPISTLDVTIENGELWVKPSTLKKRRIVPKSRGQFLDEVEGTRYTFNKDEEGKIASLTFEFEGSSYTAMRVVLPAPSLKGNTTFRLKGYADAQVVALAGSFNNWNQSQLIFAREGDAWVCRLDLNPGKYTYKFIVDGNWLLDPDNPNKEEDEAGNINSVLIVGDK